ncbi:phosphatidate cytidylyltransferase [Candidatus Liberibacter americanus]|nr:phosphatidate cytidylyltransferase [Candidatus Liberibacter americanus]
MILRILTSILVACIFLSALWIGGIWFRILAIIIGLSVYCEWVNITNYFAVNLGEKILELLFCCLISYMIIMVEIKSAVFILVLYSLISAFISIVRGRAFWHSLGVIYSGLPSVAMVFLRGDDFKGFIVMLFVLSVVWTTDVFAYFIGKQIGGPKMAPIISPGKTWAGSIGGAVCAICIGCVVLYFFLGYKLHSSIVLAALITVSSQLGDLFESFVKRYFRVKQSGWVLPGHGGMMDRFDGLIFACSTMIIVALLSV